MNQTMNEDKNKVILCSQNFVKCNGVNTLANDVVIENTSNKTIYEHPEIYLDLSNKKEIKCIYCGQSFVHEKKDSFV
jgi:uncharacterized Zn-finger protein